MECCLHSQGIPCSAVPAPTLALCGAIPAGSFWQPTYGAGLCSSREQNHHHLHSSCIGSQRVGVDELDSTIKTKQTKHKSVKGCYSNFGCIIHSSLVRCRQEQMNFNHFRLMEIIFSAHVITEHISSHAYFITFQGRELEESNASSDCQLCTAVMVSYTVIKQCFKGRQFFLCSDFWSSSKHSNHVVVEWMWCVMQNHVRTHESGLGLFTKPSCVLRCTESSVPALGVQS